MMTAIDALMVRNKFKDDFHRPIFHYLPPANWINDPNGVIQWQGRYHLFFQYNPDAAIHRNMHWGHAVSDDLIHWQDLPIALAPTPNSPDEAGIFSGSAINNNGQPVIFYTGVRGSNYEEQNQCMAIGSPDLLHWEKHPSNPVIAEVPEEAGQNTDFRDPFVWQGPDGWYMLVGSGIVDRGGTVFLYHSTDLVNWTYLHPLLTGQKEKNGAIWECPNFFQIDAERWVLIISAHTGYAVGTVKYFVGTYQNRQFTPIHSGDLDMAYLYAPLTLEDDQGRRLMWGWLREGRPEAVHAKAGWAGVQSIPRQLSLDTQNRLLMEPVTELNAIHGTEHAWPKFALSDESLVNLRGWAFDIWAEFAVEPNGQLKFSVACSPAGDEYTEIIYDAQHGELSVNREFSSKSTAVEKDNHVMPHLLDENETLELRILLDGSTLEVIANKRTSIATRIYPTQRESDNLRLTGHGVRVEVLKIYEMPSIWP